MADTRRRLPVLNTPSTGADSEGQAAPDIDTPPAWHWVPLGSVVTLGVAVVLARLIYMPWMKHQLQSVCGGLAEADCTRALAATGMGFRLSLSGVALAIWLVSTLVGAWIVGRYGTRTDRRHGALGALCASIIIVLVQQRNLTPVELVSFLVLIPVSGVVGWVMASTGERYRLRAERTH